MQVPPADSTERKGNTFPWANPWEFCGSALSGLADPSTQSLPELVEQRRRLERHLGRCLLGPCANQKLAWRVERKARTSGECARDPESDHLCTSMLGGNAAFGQPVDQAAECACVVLVSPNDLARESSA